MFHLFYVLRSTTLRHLNQYSNKIAMKSKVLKRCFRILVTLLNEMKVVYCILLNIKVALSRRSGANHWAGLLDGGTFYLSQV